MEYLVKRGLEVRKAHAESLALQANVDAKEIKVTKANRGYRA